jgi:hypothetical protein
MLMETKMDNKGFFVFAVSLLIFLIVGSVFVFAVGNKRYGFDRIFYVKDNSENVSCNLDADCVDDNLCTLHYCEKGFCRITDVVLCYQNDGCCPKGCKPENDNDC